MFLKYKLSTYKVSKAILGCRWTNRNYFPITISLSFDTSLKIECITFDFTIFTVRYITEFQSYKEQKLK